MPTQEKKKFQSPLRGAPVPTQKKSLNVEGAAWGGGLCPHTHTHKKSFNGIFVAGGAYVSTQEKSFNFWVHSALRLTEEGMTYITAKESNEQIY